MKLLLFSLLFTFNTYSMPASSEVKSCFACHGENGNSVTTNIPKINGQLSPFLVLQLKNFRSGERPNPAMMDVAKKLSDKEIEDIAEYFSKQRPMNGIIVKQSSQLQHGKEIYTKGKPGAPACMYCHGESGEGVAPIFPRLAGQHADFIYDSIRPYKINSKFKNPYAMVMKAVVQELNDQDVKDVGLYLSSLKSGGLK